MHYETTPISSVFHIDLASSISKQNQIIGFFENSIMSGSIRAGNLLPSTRLLADELNVSRRTVLIAYEVLVAEGFITSRKGSGFFVSEDVPLNPYGDSGTEGRAKKKQTVPRSATRPGLENDVNRKPGLLSPGHPGLDTFPGKIWANLSRNFWLNRTGISVLAYGDAAGFLPLREAIAEHLGVARGLVCGPEEVIITSGAQQSIDIAARVLLNQNDKVWVENPSNRTGQSALQAAGGRLIQVPVDIKGLCVLTGIQLAADAKLAYVTPARHYPLGFPMLASRRKELLDWASEHNSWILEDDYDGEIRYAGRPYRPLRADTTMGCNRVIYIGTFSKVLAPGLRLGYMLPPPGLIQEFTAACRAMYRHQSGPDQAILATFIASGGLASHLRRIRIVYRKRQDILLLALRDYCGDILSWDPSIEDAGLHIPTQLTAKLHSGYTDEIICQKARTKSITATPMSTYYREVGKRSNHAGFAIGFGSTKNELIRPAVKILAGIIRDHVV